jgi:putative glycosyltransferase
MKSTAPHRDIVPGHQVVLMTGLADTTGDVVFLSDSDLDEEPELMTQFHARFARVDCDVVFGVQETRHAGGSSMRLASFSFAEAATRQKSPEE